MLDVPDTKQKSYADGKILKDVADGVGVITFNNPDKRNAVSVEGGGGLGRAQPDLREEEKGPLVIRAGAGERASVGGAKISKYEKPRHNAAASEEYSKKSAA